MGAVFNCLIVGRVPLRMPLATNYRVTGNVYITTIIFFLELISALHYILLTENSFLAVVILLWIAFS